MAEEWLGRVATMRNDWSGQSFPHPPGRRPFIGDVPRDRDPRTPLQNTMARCRELGPIFELRIISTRIVFVQGAALNEELSEEARFGKMLAPAVANLRMFVRDGLFTAYTDEPSWRVAHDLLVPAFTKAAMRNYHDVMNAVCDELIDAWDRADGPVDVSPDLTRMTLETIGRTSFSHTFNSFTQSGQDEFVRSMVAGLTHGLRRQILTMLPFGRRLVRRRDAQARVHQAVIYRTVDEIIAARIASGDTSDRDLLGLMLHEAHRDTGQRLDLENVRHQILTFLVAGHETTSGALSFALYFLATHPQVRARAQAEVDAVLGDMPGGRPSFEQIPRLRYLRRVLDETLRLWPTAPAYARSPFAATTIGGGIRMTPEDWALVHLPLLHRDPSVWGPEPDRFDPDNFLPERVRARLPHAYKPFGTGERACIGRQFAIHEAVLVLARLLHRYDFAADPAYQLKVSERLTLMPRGFLLAPTRR